MTSGSRQDCGSDESQVKATSLHMNHLHTSRVYMCLLQYRAFFATSSVLRQRPEDVMGFFVIDIVWVGAPKGIGSLVLALAVPCMIQRGRRAVIKKDSRLAIRIFYSRVKLLFVRPVSHKHAASSSCPRTKLWYPCASYTLCSFLPGLLDPLLTSIQRSLALCLLRHLLVCLGIYASPCQFGRRTRPQRQHTGFLLLPERKLFFV